MCFNKDIAVCDEKNKEMRSENLLSENMEHWCPLRLALSDVRPLHRGYLRSHKEKCCLADFKWRLSIRLERLSIVDSYPSVPFHPKTVEVSVGRSAL